MSEQREAIFGDRVIGVLHSSGSVDGKEANKTGAFLEFVWKDPFHVGDCTMGAGAVLRYFDNGGSYFRALISSNDTNDTFEFTIHLLSQSGNSIYKIPPYADHSEYHMDDANRQYELVRTDPSDSNGAAIYGQIAQAQISARC